MAFTVQTRRAMDADSKPSDGVDLSKLNEESARLLLASVRDYAIYTVDLEGRVTSWNVGAANIKGYTAEEVIGQHFSVFYAPEDREASEPDLALHAAAAGRYETEQWRVRKDGTRFWASVLMTPLRDEAGQLIGFAKVTRDLTERHQREEERLRLARAEEFLRVRDEFFNETRKRLDGVIVGLRVHVAALTSTVDSASGHDVKAKLQMMEWGIQRLATSIDQVLDLARTASDRMAAHLDEVRSAAPRAKETADRGRVPGTGR